MTSTPHSLLQRLNRHDTADWERFVQLYSPFLFALARRLGLDDSEADDFVQDAFTRLLERIDSYERTEQHRFRDWLKTVALNVWRDYCRKRFPATGIDVP
jgi:RNA polymerase sigma factor (sigma-70 family)